MAAEVSGSSESVCIDTLSETSDWYIGEYLTFLEQKVSKAAQYVFQNIASFFTNSYQTLQSYFFSAKHTIVERIFRTSYFRLAALSDGWVERWANRLFLSMSKATCTPPVFDPERAERSLNLFKALGSQEAFVTPKDEQASVHMITLKAKDFEKKLKSFGADWERQTLLKDDGSFCESFVITCPNTSTQWQSFKHEILAKFGWREVQLKSVKGESFLGIITSENADVIKETECFSKMFLFCHSPSTSFIHDRERAAYYLGMKQDVCMFDSRGIWKSKGSASEGGFYLDAERVLEELLKEHHYSLASIWVGGKCSGAHLAAHLKAKYHDEGINFFAEGSFINVERDFVSSLDPISRYVYGICLPAIRIQEDASKYGVNEVDFDIERLWLSLSEKVAQGKIVLIHAQNDQRLNEKVFKAFEALSRRVNENVDSITFISDDKEDVHADMCLRYVDVQRAFALSIFQTGG